MTTNSTLRQMQPTPSSGRLPAVQAGQSLLFFAIAATIFPRRSERSWTTASRPRPDTSKW